MRDIAYFILDLVAPSKLNHHLYVSYMFGTLCIEVGVLTERNEKYLELNREGDPEMILMVDQCHFLTVIFRVLENYYIFIYLKDCGALRDITTHIPMQRSLSNEVMDSKSGSISGTGRDDYRS